VTLDGLTNSHALLIEIQRAIMKSAGRVIFCLDHTKFGRKSVAFLCNLDSAPTVVTDAAAPLELVDGLRAKGLEVLQASETGVDRGSTPSRTPAPEAPQQAAESAASSDTVEQAAEAESAVSMVGWD
jgi:hypothetical protein